MRTLIAGGTVVTTSASYPADVLVDGERIAEVAAPGAIAAEFDRVVDAGNRLVVPGGVDAHTHMELPVSGTVSSDDFVTGTIAAAIGGTTTIVDYAGQTRGSTLRRGLDTWMERADGRSAIDFGFHMMVTDVNPTTLDEFAAMVEAGVTTFKLFTAYPGTNYSDDGQILEAMQRAAELDATVMMHAENGMAIDVLRAQALARGETDPIFHLVTRPTSLEAEAVYRMVALAEIAGCRLVIVHISSADALHEVVLGRDRGVLVYAETCPQYLTLGIEDLPSSFDAAKFVCSPPLRWRQEGHQETLWSGIATGRVDLVATDHCSFTWEQKQAGVGDFTKIPNGVGSIEHRLDLVYQGVVDGRFSESRWVEVCATAPARLAGIYPKKGTIAPGSDADLVIYDPDRRHILGVDTHHMNTDFSVFEALEVIGGVDTVLSRGDVIVENGTWVGEPGRGRYLVRGPNQLA